MRRLPQPAIRALVFAAVASGTVALVIAIGGGLSTRVGPFTIRSHNPARPFVLALAFLGLASACGINALSSALNWHWKAVHRYAATAAAAVAMAAIGAAIHWGAFVAGGSDSYCYLNQAELMARGTVHDREPLAQDSSWPGNAWSFAPAGHVPAGQPVPALVPICPAGYPLLMAAARRVGGRGAMFAVTPLMGGLAVYLVFLLGRHVAGPVAGLIAAVLTASSPTVLYQLFQPMSDVTAAAFWAAALVAAIRASTGAPVAAVGAGMATAGAIVVRPNLVPLAAVVGLGVLLLARDRRPGVRLASTAAFAATASTGLLMVFAVQNAMYGSPFKSGYGDLDQMFAVGHVLPNLQRYLRWTVESHTIVIAAALIAPLAVFRYESTRVAAWLLLFGLVTLACYLPYVVFDAWWYTRFLLPGLLPAFALMSAAFVAALERLPGSLRFASLTLAGAALVTLFLQFGNDHDVFRIRNFEWRFRSVGEFAAALPVNAAFITLHHSGSLRFYAGKSTLGWADIEKGRFDDAIAFLKRHGRKPYLVFESWEEPQFRERFAGERLGQLDWPPAAEVDDVRIYDPDDYTRAARGDSIRTMRIETRK